MFWFHQICTKRITTIDYLIQMQTMEIFFLFGIGCLEPTSPLIEKSLVYGVDVFFDEEANGKIGTSFKTTVATLLQTNISTKDGALA
jgi:predicted ATPase